MVSRKDTKLLLKQQQETPTPPKPASAEVSRVQNLFTDADADNSGYVDETELEAMVKNLVASAAANLDAAFETDNIHRTCRAAMEKHGDDGLLSLDRFVQMVSSKPFVGLVGSGVRDELVLKAGELRSIASPRRSRPEPSEAQAYFREVKAMFDTADKDASGRLEGDELADLIVEMHKKAGKQIEGKVRFGLVETVRKQAAGVDANDRGLDLAQFMRVLMFEPWCDLLEPHLRSSMAFLILKATKVEAPKSGPEVCAVSL